MRLAVARVCLDCEEIHEDERCPVCGSETFVFLRRCVKLTDRTRSETASRAARSIEVSDRVEQVDAYRELLGVDRQRPRRALLVVRGGLGLAILGLARAAWGAGRALKSEWSARGRTRG